MTTIVDRPATDSGLPVGIMAAWQCPPGQRVEPLSALPEEPELAGALWIDIDPEADPAELARTLASLAPTLTEGDLADLLERDELAKTNDDAVGFRNASFVGFAIDRPADPARTPGDLVVQMVEVLVGDRLLLSCWQHSLVFRGDGDDHDRAPALRQQVLREAAEVWCDSECETAADLASALVHELLVASRTVVCEVEQALQAWELDYHAGRGEGDTATLKRLLAMVNEIRRRLTAFDIARPSRTPIGKRFDNAVGATLAAAVDTQTKAALDRYGVLLEGIRSDMELVSMDKMAHQAVMAEDRARRDEVFQGRLEKVTALLLVPTLIAGIFGANTALPGGGTWGGFDAMLVLMVATSLGVYVFLSWKRLERRRAEAP